MSILTIVSLGYGSQTPLVTITREADPGNSARFSPSPWTPLTMAQTDETPAQPEVSVSASSSSSTTPTPASGPVVPGEDAITMMDVLHEEESLESDARAVLGAADDKNCTYHTGGYMARQALYSCLTCLPASNPDFVPAGICLACSYHCHEGHELVELYTKRQFRCDCGNKTFGDELNCRLANDKSSLNSDNRYNQNFKGIYCTCHRPYPDPDDPVEDEMIQCIVCEDWYHGRHLGLDSIPKDNSYSEMMCIECVKKHDFLLAFHGLTVHKVTKDEKDPNDSVDVALDQSHDETTESSKLEESASKALESRPKICFHAAKIENEPQTMFMGDNWRKQICTCDLCRAKLAQIGLEFLADLEDTVHHYESQSKQKEGSSQYEDGMKALSEMDRVKQIEAIQSYNSMKSNLMDYLKKFAENGKVVRQEDIQEFFSGLKSNKRQRVEIPKFCR
eukprot:maker-scaffold160_size295910-snap-gene-1.36 protein:Tk01236 transcript:maker-scaffold160_size295910-snap-gene-1.36-mRNA-1 annotation:"c14orf130 homolog"